jgi:long-chain fatty acid transport protein
MTMKLIPALVLAVCSSYATASGFQLIEQNASGLGNAYAGSAAVADNASTIFYNPAGMTQLKAREFSAGLTAVQTSFKFSNSGSNVGATLGASGNGGDGGVLGVIPNGYVSWALSKDLYLGLGVGAPFGLKTEYGNPWIGAAQSLSFDIKTVNVNPSIAYRVSEAVSLGFGVDWQKIDAEYKSLGGTATGPRNVTALLKLNDDAWGWNAGALFTLSPATKVGISYRSEIKYNLTGSSTLTSDGTAFGNGGLAALRAAGAASSPTATLKLPDTWILSATHKLNDQVEVLGDLSHTGWSSVPRLTINYSLNGLQKVLNTDFRDTWRVALGAHYKLSDTLKLKFGIAYDQTPVKGEATRLVSLPDNDRTWLSIGTQWAVSKDSKVDVGFAYLLVKDAKINNNQNSLATGANTVTGTYKDSAWILGAQYSMAF